MSLKDPEIRQLLEWFANNSETRKREYNPRRRAIKENQKWIKPNIIQNMSDEELESKFLEYYKSGGGRQAFNPIYRDRIIRDKKRFTQTLLYLLDESVDIKERIDQVLNGTYHIEGFGRAIASSFLMDWNPNKYSLWNEKIGKGFSVLGWEIHERGDSDGTTYTKVIQALKKLKGLCPKFNLEFLDIDLFLHTISAEDEGSKAVETITNKISSKEGVKEKGYWIFQGNPNIYNIIEALRDGNLKTFFVKTHKDKIKSGDKVILWVTGNQSGCYALCTITSKVIKKKIDPADEKYYTDKGKEKYNTEISQILPLDKVEIKIDHNLCDRPILYDSISNKQILKDLKVGLQGTNFTANKEQYEEFLKLAKQPYIWIEKSEVKGRDDRKIGERALGKMLWSPQKNNSGADIYKYMRQIKENDIILHLIDNTNFSGISLAKSKYFEGEGIEGTRWEGPAYLIELQNYQELTPSIPRDEILNEDNKNLLLNIKQDNEVFFQEDLGLRQGAYITPCPIKLASLINHIYFKKTGQNMPHFDPSILSETKGDSMSDNYDSVHNLSLNTILFGPPGTGKTYNTLNYALSILKNRSIEQIGEEPRNILKQKYDDYLKNGQIQFITFHQSYSYEDFIEGIKPKVISEEDEVSSDDDINNQIEYEITQGTFKKLAELASFSTTEDENKYSIPDEILDKARFYKMSLGNTLLPEDNVIYDYCLNNNVISIGYGGDYDFSSSDDQNKVAKEFTEHLKGKREPSSYEIFAIHCFRNMMHKDDIVFISKGNTKVRAIARITGEYYYDDKSPIRYNHFRDVEWLVKDVKIPASSLYERNFSQQTIYVFYQNLVKRDFFRPDLNTIGKKKFVLIIDEINRGNIANIFGELITLIEDDKRSGKQNEITTTLPYSKEVFSVPENLYIIGTMNTADRSVESLDTALRRRFSFIPMYPKPDLLDDEEHKCENIDLKKMLETINQRIEKLKDLDYGIGHSYFMNIENKTNPLEELKHIFQNKVIPLLQEYFYNDWEKIGLILGSEFVSENANNTKFASNFKPNDDDDYDGVSTKKIYIFTSPDNWTLDSFKSIYHES